MSAVINLTSSTKPSFKRSSPPKLGAHQTPVDLVQISGEQSEAFQNSIIPPELNNKSYLKVVSEKPKFPEAHVSSSKSTGLTIGAIALGAVGLTSALFGIVNSGGSVPSQPVREPEVEQVKETPTSMDIESKIELASEVGETQVVEEKKPSFEDGRELLVDRSERVKAEQFQPDPSDAIAQRKSIITFSESHIRSLVDRNLTEVPEGAPSFTAHGVDPGQSSKLYFDADLQPAEFGKGSLRTGGFHTRPDRMKVGMGIRDQIVQYQLSGIYKLENQVTMDGVTLEPGLYRVTSLAPASRVTTKQMHHAVAPGHRLVTGDSGFRGDYKPVQVDENGTPLKVNPDDIVQIWSLTEAEAAEFSNP